MNRSPVVGVVTTVLLLSLRVLASVVWERQAAWANPFAIALLAALGLLLWYALASARPAGQPDPLHGTPLAEGGRRWHALLWLAWVLVALICWPHGLDIQRQGLATYLLLAPFILLPGVIADRLGQAHWLRRWMEPYRTGLVLLGLSVALLSTVTYFIVCRPSVGSVDFFYYICFARDMHDGVEDLSDMRYGYFPGVYTFWRLAMSVTGGSLAGLQSFYLVVLAVNATLIAVVIYRQTRSDAAALLAAIWYAALLSRYQGLTGVTEPIATLPLLVGLALWNGRVLRGADGLFSALALGVALGAAVYTRQQAGLLSLGAIALLLNYRRAPSERRHRLGLLALIPAVATVTLLVGILAEGQGWKPLWYGLRKTAVYASEGSLLLNLYTQVRADESAAIVALLVVAAVVYLFSSPRASAVWGTSWYELASFCTVAGLATSVQFFRRAYGHYSLLAVPCLVIAAVLLAHRAACAGSSRAAPSQFMRLTWLLLAAVPLVYTAGSPATLHVWRVVLPQGFTPHTLWHRQETIAADLDDLRRYVRPGENLYLVPPRHNAIHFLLQTRCPADAGYGFVIPDLEEMQWDKFDAVLVITDQLDESDRRAWQRIDRARLQRALDRHQFRSSVAFEAMTLYRRR